MGEAQIDHVGHQPRGEFVPVRRAAIRPEPRAGVHLVDRQRRIHAVPAGTPGHPGGVVPDQRRGIGNHRGGGGRRLGRACQRVRLQRQARSVRSDDGEFVARARFDARHEQLPHPRRIAQPHRMPPRVPGIEIADHRHRARIRCPHREAHAGHPVNRHHPGAEMLRQFEMPSLVEQMQVQIAQRRAEAIGILGLLHAAGPADAQQVRFGAVNSAREQARRGRRRKPAERLAAVPCQHLHVQRARQKCPHHAPRDAVVRPENRERIGKRTVRQCLGKPGVETRQIGHVVHCSIIVRRRRSINRTRPYGGTSVRPGSVYSASIRQSSDWNRPGIATLRPAASTSPPACVTPPANRPTR